MTMMQKAICLNLSLSKLGTRRKAVTEKAAEREGGTHDAAQVAEQVAEGAVVSGADATAISASKRLLDSAELKAVSSLDSEIKAYLEARALPSPFRGGIWLIPIRLVEEVNSALEDYKAKRGDLVDAFIAAYEDAIEEARGKLGPLFNLSDYKSENEAREAFKIEWQFVSMETPQKLKEVAPDVFEQEKARAEALWRSAADDVQLAMRAAMQELIGHTAERLRQRPDGTRPVLRDSVLGNMRQFLDFFDARNLTDDDDLAALVARAREVLDNVDTEALRRDPNLRQNIGDAVAALIPTAEDLVAQPKRRIQVGGAAEADQPQAGTAAA